MDRLHAVILGAVLLPAAAVAGAPPPEEARIPTNVLLITVDTLRPDALGWVAGKNTTPAIDALAAEGFRFPAASSPVPITQPAHASLLTGLLPRRHGVRDNGQVLGPGPATLGERLGGAGYATAAVVSGYPLAAEFGLDRGFDHYDDQLTAGEGGRYERPAAETTAAALAWLAAVAEPWFLWVHYYDPHDPYAPPAEFARPGPRGAYDGEVAYVDAAIGELRRGLAATGPVLTVFAADHGESLGEHGEETHGFFIYESTVAVPLLFHLPGQIKPGESPGAARLVDVAPTALALLGQPPLAAVAGAAADGVSLAGFLAAAGDRELPPAYVETRRPWLSYGWSTLRAVRQGSWKLIAAPRPELYDLAADPGEERNLVDLERPTARRLRNLLLAAEEPPGLSSEALADPEAMARLRTLGYVGAGTARGEPTAGLADPKDRLDLWNALSEAQTLLDRRHWAAAVERFDAVLEQEPENPFALSRSGAALVAAGDLTAAVPRLERAVAQSPDDTETRTALARALTGAGKWAAAAVQWMELARLRPRKVDAWVNLAVTLGRSGQGEEAIGALERAVELAPERGDLRTQLAFTHHAAGRPAKALEHLLLAAETGGERFPYPAALGLLLVRQGRGGEARDWLARSRPGEGDYATARFELARLLGLAGDAAAARDELRRALAAAPELRARAAADPVLAPLVESSR